VLADAGLMISHGGHGTATRALTAGVPVLVRPMSSLGDHLFVARGLEHAGAGRRLPTRASALELTALIDASLRDDALRARAQTLGERLRPMESARLAGDAVEAAMTSAVGGRTAAA
jgi:UDP:flavonoid glycosyltransferase YjiC (YdhE family)